MITNSQQARRRESRLFGGRRKVARETDEQVVERARRMALAGHRMRWVMFVYAAVFLGFCAYATIRVVWRIENLPIEQLTSGFVFGIALAILYSSFGLAGAVCLGKFLAGFSQDFRMQRLLVAYHDRLLDLVGPSGLPNNDGDTFRTNAPR